MNMAIIYSDGGGYVSEELRVESVYENSIDFCDGFVYFTSAVTDADGYPVERKIPISALVRIIY